MKIYLDNFVIVIRQCNYCVDAGNIFRTPVINRLIKNIIRHMRKIR